MYLGSTPDSRLPPGRAVDNPLATAIATADNRFGRKLTRRARIRSTPLPQPADTDFSYALAERDLLTQSAFSPSDNGYGHATGEQRSNPCLHDHHGEGVSGLRIYYGPSYRVHFKQNGRELIILLAGAKKEPNQGGRNSLAPRS